MKFHYRIPAYAPRKFAAFAGFPFFQGFGAFTKARPFYPYIRARAPCAALFFACFRVFVFRKWHKMLFFPISPADFPPRQPSGHCYFRYVKLYQNAPGGFSAYHMIHRRRVSGFGFLSLHADFSISPRFHPPPKVFHRVCLRHPPAPFRFAHCFAHGIPAPPQESPRRGSSSNVGACNDITGGRFFRRVHFPQFPKKYPKQANRPRIMRGNILQNLPFDLRAL